jgi:hypothetical protein
VQSFLSPELGKEGKEIDEILQQPLAKKKKRNKKIKKEKPAKMEMPSFRDRSDSTLIPESPSGCPCFWSSVLTLKKVGQFPRSSDSVVPNLTHLCLPMFGKFHLNFPASLDSSFDSCNRAPSFGDLQKWRVLQAHAAATHGLGIPLGIWASLTLVLGERATSLLKADEVAMYSTVQAVCEWQR